MDAIVEDMLLIKGTLNRVQAKIVLVSLYHKHFDISPPEGPAELSTVGMRDAEALWGDDPLDMLMKTYVEADISSLGMSFKEWMDVPTPVARRYVALAKKLQAQMPIKLDDLKK